MSLLVEEIIERLAHRYDHEEVCDLLGVGVQELLERFDDKITAKYEELCEELEDA
jgi:DNA-directed RNA polymerase specialized sigma subunit